MNELTEEELELVYQAYEILAKSEATSKLFIGFPLPPHKPK